MKQFIKNTLIKLVKESSKVNAAIVLYNHQVRVRLNFTQELKMNHFFNIMGSLRILDPGTNFPARPDQALQITSEHVFGTQGGSRLNTPKITVLFTQGGFSFAPLHNVSELLRNKSVRLLIVGIEPDRNQLQTYGITEDPGDFLKLSNFSNIREPSVEDSLVRRICLAIGQY